jgi:hypothetical protein
MQSTEKRRKFMWWTFLFPFFLLFAVISSSRVVALCFLWLLLLLFHIFRIFRTPKEK